jgi:hypothetical protein
VEHDNDTVWTAVALVGWIVGAVILAHAAAGCAGREVRPPADGPAFQMEQALTADVPAGAASATDAGFSVEAMVIAKPREIDVDGRTLTFLAAPGAPPAESALPGPPSHAARLAPTSRAAVEDSDERTEYVLPLARTRSWTGERDSATSAGPQK